MIVSVENLIEAFKVVATVAIFFVWFIRYDNIKKEFIIYKYPPWFRDLVGILKISFVVMLHSSRGEVVVIGSLGIVILMCGAVITHIKNRSEFQKYIASVVMLLISSSILYFTIQSL